MVRTAHLCNLFSLLTSLPHRRIPNDRLDVIRPGVQVVISQFIDVKSSSTCQFFKYQSIYLPDMMFSDVQVYIPLNNGV